MKNAAALHLRRCASIQAVAMALCLAGAPAHAQETPVKPTEAAANPTQQPDDATAGSTVDDIVVTANRREQRTQNVGIAVSAYSGETLTRSGINSTTDLGAITPGLAITLVTPGQPALIAIRGISQSNYAGQLESTNAYYVDDNYQVLSSTNSQGLYDVARVETLKGPQGTLFGRNANGGLGRKSERFIHGIRVETLAATKHTRHGLIRNPHNVVERLLLGQRAPGCLHVRAHQHGSFVCRAEAIAHDVSPNSAGRSQLAYFLEELIVRVEEE